MRKLLNELTVIVLWLFPACSYVEIDVSVEGRQEFRALLESEPETRTHLSGPENGIYYPYWSGEEIIGIWSDRSASPSRVPILSGKDTREAVFSGPVTDGKRYVALYPYEEEGRLDGDILSLTLPSEQTYAPGSFGEGAFPMLAVSGNQTLSFRNLCSVLRISMTGKMEVQSILFNAHDSRMGVSGTGTVGVDQPESPVLVMAEDASPSVELMCGSIPLSETEPTDFFIVLPPGTYAGGFTLKIKTSEGTVTRSTDKDVVFSRSRMRSFPAFECKDARIDPEDLPDNVLLYTTVDGSMCTFWQKSAFDRQIVSHTYEDGWGMVVFDGPLKVVNSGFTNDNGYRIATEIIFPPSVEEFGYFAFSGSPLRSVRLPKNLKSVHIWAFRNCPQLKRFYGPHATSDEKGIEIDGELVAYIGVPDEVLRIPEGIRTIKNYCIFDNFSEEARQVVKHIVFPEGLISAGTLTDFLHSLPSIETITLPSTLQDGDFDRCPNLRAFKGNNPCIRDGGNCLVNAGGVLFGFAGYGITDYVIPDGVTVVNNNVFQGKTSLRSVTFPSTITGIAKPIRGGGNLRHFYGPIASEDGQSLIWDGAVSLIAPDIEDYTSPKGIKKIAYAAFLDLPVRHIILRDCVTTVDEDGFAWAHYIESIILSRDLKVVGNNAFNSNYNLKEIYFRSPNPPACGKMTWTDFPEGFVAYVPKGSLEAYLNSSDWSFLPRNFKEYEPEDTVAPDWYVSTDYSRDGKVEVLQRASEGNGIDLVLMGDGFSDRQIGQGTYGRVMQKMADAFFSEEPYKSYRKLFNVYSVDVVSETEGYAHDGQALGTRFKEGTEVAGSDQTCIIYARKAIPDDRVDNALILVAMDSTAYAGTCYMYYSSAYHSDWGEGVSVAYFPLGETDATLAQLVHHEAGGHGFAKLADEYAYESLGPVPGEKIEETLEREPYGWWKNIDFTSDPAKVKWARFLADERYRYDGLGVFEGGLTYWSGVWRPTENSIMRHNTGGFNAPSREAIWYRLHKLAYGSSWQYDYEEFVSYDAVNRKTSASGAAYAPRETRPPLHPPVVMEKSWREVIDE